MTDLLRIEDLHVSFATDEGRHSACFHRDQLIAGAEMPA